ncbi:MAG: M20 family metallopeptidase [Elusimicrobia bacterium]|nr:M20 family metallopeptidase [Candidatus Liberimonas magnetica]
MDNKISKNLISIRRQIHTNPELSSCEFKTAAFIEKKLKQAGIKTIRLAKTGVIGIINGTGTANGKKRSFALRADIDALPIKEETNKPYASKNSGVMHACGHDANTTIVLGAGFLLNRERRSFSGTVKLIFQPSEEDGNGAAALIKAGVLLNPRVEAIVGVHVNPWLKTGEIGLKYDEMMAAVDKFNIEILGNSGHGAYPHLGKDAVVIASQVINSIQTVVSRETDPTEPIVITIGKIQGGNRYNVLCGKVELEGTVRTLNEKLHRLVPKIIEKKIKYITKAYGAGYKFNYEVVGYPLRNTKKILELCKKTGENILGKNRVKILKKPSMGGEDFSEYLRQVPGCFVYLGSSKKNSYSWHHEKFDIDENVLSNGANLLFEIAKEFLNSDK